MTVGGSWRDDPTIADDAILWRRIRPDWIVFDQNTGRYRPTSQAFHDSRGGHPMSVHLAEIAQRPEVVLAGQEGYGLVSFTSGLAREMSQAIVRDPTPNDPSHALVAGRKTGAVSSRFARESVWIVEPGDLQRAP